MDENHTAVSKLLATPGIDVNAADENGSSPLWKAVHAEHETLVDQLLAAPGIDVNIRNKYGTAPLMTAAYMGNRGVVERLLVALALISKLLTMRA